MTDRKPPKPPVALLGPPTKTCQTCGALIERDGMNNMAWLRKTFCGRECHYKAIASSAWKRKTWKNDSSSGT